MMWTMNIPNITDSQWSMIPMGSMAAVGWDHQTGPQPLTHWGRDKMDATFKRIFVNENVWILIEISLKFVPKGPINNIPALVQIMAWCRPGDKPLSEPMMVSLPTHICVTRPQWVKTLHHPFLHWAIDMLNTKNPLQSLKCELAEACSESNLLHFIIRQAINTYLHGK